MLALSLSLSLSLYSKHRQLVDTKICIIDFSRPEQVRVAFGLTELTKRESGTFAIVADLIIVHGEYNVESYGSADVALVRMKSTVPFSPYVQPVCLVDGPQIVEDWTRDRHCFAIGYGRVKGERPTLQLQKMRVIAVNRAKCAFEGILPHETEICLFPRDKQQASPCPVSTDTGSVCSGQ